jgi:pimeloyl-ACP methyl ester carboxylesterase
MYAGRLAGRAAAVLSAGARAGPHGGRLDIHFIHVKSPHADTLPLIMTHGWPGSVIEMLGVVVPLTDPAAHGGRAEDAFDLVLPSLPGYGLSDEPTDVGWDPGRVAQAWAELMRRLGYTRYVAQGGDVGTAVTDAMGRQATRGAAWHPPQLAPGPAARRLPASGIRAGTRGARRARTFRTSDRATSSTRLRGRRLSATPCWIHPSP